MSPHVLIDVDAAGEPVETSIGAGADAADEAAGAGVDRVLDAAAGKEHATVFDHDEALVQLPHVAAAAGDERMHPGNTPSIETDDEATVEDVLIESLDRGEIGRVLGVG